MIIIFGNAKGWKLPLFGILSSYLRVMKQKEQEPDYRSMNEVQLKYELIKLEKQILDITCDPIDYKHYGPFLDWCRDDAKVEAVEEMMLDRSYILNLLFEIHCTPAEVARLEKINGMLLEMTNRTYHRTADLQDFFAWYTSIPAMPYLKTPVTIPADVDFLITHGPAYSYLDRDLGCKQLFLSLWPAPGPSTTSSAMSTKKAYKERRCSAAPPFSMCHISRN